MLLPSTGDEGGPHRDSWTQKRITVQLENLKCLLRDRSSKNSVAAWPSKEKDDVDIQRTVDGTLEV